MGWNLISNCDNEDLPDYDTALATTTPTRAAGLRTRGRERIREQHGTVRYGTVRYGTVPYALAFIFCRPRG